MADDRHRGFTLFVQSERERDVTDIPSLVEKKNKTKVDDIISRRAAADAVYTLNCEINDEYRDWRVNKRRKKYSLPLSTAKKIKKRKRKRETFPKMY